MDPETDIMEQPWGLSDYKPTKIIHIWQKRLSEAQVVSLSARRATDTKNINRHPYDPELWIKRAYAHAVLGYPELAVGDAFKAELLCRKLLAELDQNLKPNYRIGVHAGFWMRHEDPEDEYDEVPPWLDTIDLEKEHSKHQTKFTCILDDAEKVKRANLVFSPHREEGKFSPQAYPWMSREHSMRLEYDIDQINAELQNPLVSRPTGLMVVKRYAFGKGVGRQDGADLLGGFALRDIEEDEMVINDRSKLWAFRKKRHANKYWKGCIGPGKDDERWTDHDGLPANGRAANLGGGYGCASFFHPNHADDSTDHDIRWIRDRLGPDAAHSILLVRSLLHCVQDRVDHPLDHTHIARITPQYAPGVERNFSVEKEIRVINEALVQFGIDIFANLNFDTWVLFEIEARLSNNSWSDTIATCLSPLFCMINHSCEPNLYWCSQPDHSTLKITAKRDIKKGEQLLLEYDQYQGKNSLADRRQRLKKWLGSDCQCTRCVREERKGKSEMQMILEKQGLGHLKILDGSGLSQEALGEAWNTGEPVELPEDAVIDGKWAALGADKNKKKKRRTVRKSFAGSI